MTTSPDHEGLGLLLRLRQDGVVSRGQLIGLGLSTVDIRRMLRRRELTTVHPGVYVTHTGPLTPEQREWAAVLAVDGVLAGRSALPGARTGAVVHVAVDDRRTVAAPKGVQVQRMAGLGQRTHPTAAPPRLRYAEAVVDVVAAASDEMAAYTVMADALHSRLVSTGEIRAAAGARARLRRRRLLLALLDDLDSGACSVLERAYRSDVEQAHALPPAQRQAAGRVEGRAAYRDVRYAGWGLYVELDGRAFHDNPRARDRDLARDLAAVVEDGSTTLRLGYGQVLGAPCATAASVAAVLQRAGWTGPLVRCPRCPAELGIH